MRHHAAFTIIEMMVVVLIIGAIVSLTLPLLSKARINGYAIKSSSNLKQLAMAIHSYTTSNQDCFPRIEPDEWYLFDADSSFMFPQWQVDETWFAVVYQELPRWEHEAVYYCPKSTANDGIPGDSLLTSYRYSWALAAHKSFWSSSPDPAGASRHARAGQLAFPSQKALLWDREVTWRTTRPKYVGLDLAELTPVASCDGSVLLRFPSLGSTPVENTQQPQPNAMGLRNTADGSAGTDY